MLCILHEGEIVVGILGLAVTAHDDLQRHAAHAGEGQQRVWYLRDHPLHLHHLPMPFRTVNVEQQESRHRLDIIEPSASEGRAEDEVRQGIGAHEVVARGTLFHLKARGHRIAGNPVGCRFGGF